MKVFALLFILTLSSCAFLVTSPTVELVRVPNIELWKGRSSDELTLHPIYATLPLENRNTSDGMEIRSYKNSGQRITSANCTGMYAGSSCSGVSSEIACNHVFYIKDRLIIDLKRVGACGPEDIMFRPLDAEGNPLLAPEEKASLERKIASEGPLVCKMTSDCKGMKSCRNGHCMDLGLWGLIFN